MLVGTQSDLRADAKTLVGLRHSKEHPIQESEARKLAHSLGGFYRYRSSSLPESSGCETYVESSSLTQDNLKEVFDNAIMEGLRSRQERARKKGKKKKKCTIL